MLNLQTLDQNHKENEEHPPENRKAMRIKHRGTIMVSDESCDYYSYAQIGNVSSAGMYFESDHAFKQGKIIGIRFDNPPFKTAPKNYRATVQWCEILSDKDSILSYGVGVSYR